MSEEQSAERICPSRFMRRLRPEYFSDSEGRTRYVLDAPTLRLHLDTITERNETHGFEIFCRKLCEQVICPNLRPATGPEGGGDSKADTETYPVAADIAKLTYIGSPVAGEQRWAFAFSAMKDWKRKARKDVAGIAGTNRGYSKIFFVTSRAARSKDRSELEGELSEKYGVQVTIHDREWIVVKIIDDGRKDLAYHYLKVGQEVQARNQLGPQDYQREQILNDLEAQLRDPQAFTGMETQRVTEALLAAKLSRGLERPRFETEGRFDRAIRLADEDGTYRQRIETRYERLWTAYCWFDDFSTVAKGYEEVERLSLDSEHANILKFLCTLLQLLSNSVRHKNLSSEQAQLEPRTSRLAARLNLIAAQTERPNNALEAQLSLLIIETSNVWLHQGKDAMAPLWPRFSEVIRKAAGLGEFDAGDLIQMIEAIGDAAGNDRGYARLIDEMSDFVGKRSSEAQGGLVLLSRARKVDTSDNLELIRLLGKAARRLTKKEHLESLVEALLMLSDAYRRAGMLWAARASSAFAICSIVIKAEETSEVPSSILAAAVVYAYAVLELRHIPDVVEAINLVRGCLGKLAVDDEAQERVDKHITDCDVVLASQVASFSKPELRKCHQLPDALEALRLYATRSALLYAMGYESLLREDGSIPAEVDQAEVSGMYTVLASQPVATNPHGPAIFNEGSEQLFLARVQGIRVEVRHGCTEPLILAAEAICGSIEVFFSTLLEHDVSAHTERFGIEVEEVSEDLDVGYRLHADKTGMTVYWPRGLVASAYDRQEEVGRALLGLAGEVLQATCYVADPKATAEKLFHADGLMERLQMVLVASNSRHRFLDSYLSTVKSWGESHLRSYPLQEVRPNIERVDLAALSQSSSTEGLPGKPAVPNDHRVIRVKSVIEVHLWAQARLFGAGFISNDDGTLSIALVFRDEAAARAIFTRWRERFGPEDVNDDICLMIVRGISAEAPSHYRLIVTTSPDKEPVGNLVTPRGQAGQTIIGQPPSEENLTRFIQAYERAGSYTLMGAVVETPGEPTIFKELGIRKRNLVVMHASEVPDGAPWPMGVPS